MKANDVLVRMLNSYSADWIVDEERVEALFAVGSFARPHEQEVMLEMIREANAGQLNWSADTKRIRAIKGAIINSRHPTADSLKQLAMAVTLGAANDGVSERPWVKDAIRMLETMSKLTP